MGPGSQSCEISATSPAATQIHVTSSYTRVYGINPSRWKVLVCEDQIGFGRKEPSHTASIQKLLQLLSLCTIVMIDEEKEIYSDTETRDPKNNTRPGNLGAGFTYKKRLPCP